jgi:centractin
MPGGALEPPDSSSSSSSSRYCYVGRKLDDHRGAFTLHYPMEHGRVVSEGSWQHMEALWDHVYNGKENLNAASDQHPVLLTEAPLNPFTNREHTAEVFFESFRVPAIYFAPQAVLSLYASGRTTGVVIDVGEGVTHSVPVYEGFALPHSITRSDIAGRDVTHQLQLLLRRSGLAFTTTAETQLVKSIKETVCYVSPQQPKSEEHGAGSSSVGGALISSLAKESSDAAKALPTTTYQLPDGQIIHLGKERFRAPEVIFRPEIIGSEELGVADALVNSIKKSDIDLRSVFYEQIVLAGGSTLFPGFGDRLLYEVRQRAPAHTRIRISAPPDRIHSAWVGGSILASLSTFKNMWVSRAEYEEYGSNILHRKAL